MNAKPASVPKDGWMVTRGLLTAKEKKVNIAKAKAARMSGRGRGGGKRTLPIKSSGTTSKYIQKLGIIKLLRT